MRYTLSEMGSWPSAARNSLKVDGKGKQRKRLFGDNVMLDVKSSAPVVSKVTSARIIWARLLSVSPSTIVGSEKPIPAIVRTYVS